MAQDDFELFGIEELEKQFEKTIKKFPDEASALLKAQGDIWRKEVKATTPVLHSKRTDRKPGQLRDSWRLKTPKVYNTTKGDVIVVRLQSAAPHAHLIEDGHKIVTRTRTRNSSGKFIKEAVKNGKTSKYNAIQRAARGIKSGGRVDGRHILLNSQKKIAKSFFNKAENLLDNLTNEYE